MEVINAVKHYQRSIERCSGNVERMLHCLQKLYCLPVTVQHLQETGVGRTVNALRKYEGDTGEAAKALVNKWKAMVAEAETSDEEVSSESHRTRTESPPPTSTSHRHKSSHSGSRRDESRAEKTKSLHKNHSSSSHSEKRRDENSTSYRSSKHSDHGHKRQHEDEKRRTEEKRRRKNVEEEEEQEEEEEEDEDDEEKEHVSDSGHESHEEVENEESDHISVAESDSSNVRDAENEDNEEASDDEDNEEASEDEDNEEASEEKEEEEEEDTEEVTQEEETEAEYVAVKMKHKSHGSKHNGISHSSHSSHSFHSENKTHSSPSDRSKNIRDRHERSNTLQEKSNYSVDHKHKKNEERRESSSKTENRSNSNSSSRVHHHEESKSRSKEKEKRREKEKNREREREKNEVRKREEVKKESKEQRKDQKSKSHIPKHEPKPSTSSSKGSSEEKNKNVSSKKVKTTVETTEDGIDSFSGTSFADALGMMGMIEPVNKKKKKQSSGGNSSSRKSDTSSGNQVSNQSTQSNQKTKEVSPQKLQPKASASTDDINLLDPSVELEPLDNLEMEMEVDVDATLPAITPNYRPLPHLNFDLPSRARARSLTEEEALSQVMSTKNQRTKVYSGVKSGKSWATVPSLYDICVRVLQENIDALEYTGGVPFDLLKPVLTHATPEQLFTLEHYNPYLVEDTDELWQSHVRRKFRNQRRLDMETHREMFQRCVEESEAKLKALTLNIQNSMAKSVPVRQTKLAYVDSIAKPPRQVARKQAKFGTAHATATTPMAKVQKLATPSGSSAGRSSSPVVHVPAPRSSHSTAKTKPRMAPLMQKTMKLAKSFKR